MMAADTAPITVEGALADYRPDLITGVANPYNADWPLLHLTSVLKSKPVALLTSIELKKWRDGLLGTMAPSTINRLCGCLRAALELAARHDKRIQNRDAWEVGLVNLPDAQQARNVILSDDKVREFVAAAYGVDDKFGLFTDTLAITGARPSQAGRLRVEDLHDHPVRPKLMMSKAAKGGSRNAAWKRNRALFRTDHHGACRQAEGSGEGPCRPCAASAAKRRQPMGRQSRRELSSLRKEDRRCHRGRSCRDDVLSPTFVNRETAIEKRAGPVGGGAAQHIDQDDRKALFEIHH